MGLLKAASGAIGGTLGDQWKDFLTVPKGIWPTAAIFPAVKNGTNFNRGSNLQGSIAVISNGSKIIVPDGYGLLVLQDGAVTAFTAESGNYTWDSDDINSQSIFAGDKFSKSLISQSWDRFKFGGRPSGQQLALFVRLQELPNNKFGTQSEIYWDDAYLNAQVGAITHGTFGVEIVDPIKFAMTYVPATYLQGNEVFDFTDIENPNATQLTNEVVSSLAAAFSRFANDVDKGNRITNIQKDILGFTQSLMSVLESSFDWTNSHGLTLSSAALLGVQYDEATRELLKTVQRADALQGGRGNANLQASIAQGIESAGEVSGSEGLFGIGIASGTLGVAGLMQSTQSQESSASSQGKTDVMETLEKLKRAFDAGLINQLEYDAAKSKALGLN
jgi:membrane protease subunit (stomatin/prohibitin family)